MPDSTLDKLAAVQQRIREREAAQAQDRAERDELLRQSWTERISQSALAQALELSMPRTGNLRRRARGVPAGKQ